MPIPSDKLPAADGPPPRVIVLGANGRLGRMLRHGWSGRITARWQARRPDGRDRTLVFDPLQSWPATGPCDVAICLAGVIRGSDAALRLNTDLALAAIEQGAARGAKRVFLASTAAVYGRADSALPESAAPNPLSPYGAAKLAMEQQGQARAAQLGLPLTVLRIGNVAGADALLGQAGTGPILLDRFADGQGPRRSYIGPLGFAAVMETLVHQVAQGDPLPPCLNLALPDAVAMADLLRAADIPLHWRPAPDAALPVVQLDVTRLAGLVPLPSARPKDIVQDWRSYNRGTG